MKNDRILAVLLVFIALLLIANLLAFVLYPGGRPAAVAANRFETVPTVNPQSLGFRGNGIGIACSDDGKYVYAAGSRSIFRSEDYGRAGSWQVALSE